MSDELPLVHVSVEPTNPRQHSPGVILLHGRGANERDLLPIANELPGDPHVLAFRAPQALGPGFTWYDLDLSAGGLHASQPDPDDFDRSVNLLTTSIEGAIDRYRLDPDRIGLLGFSQGAILSLGLFVEQPHEYAWIVGLHGYLPARYSAEELADAAGPPIFIGAGTQDQLIPASRAEESSTRLADAGVDVTFRTYPIGHGTGPDELADVAEWLRSKTDIADSEAV